GAPSTWVGFQAPEFQAPEFQAREFQALAAPAQGRPGANQDWHASRARMSGSRALGRRSIRRARRFPQKRRHVIAKAHGRGHAIVLPAAIGGTRRTRFPGLSCVPGLPWLFRQPARGADGRLQSLAAFGAPIGCAEPAIARTLWPAGLSVIATPRLG